MTDEPDLGGERRAGDPMAEASALVVEVPGADPALARWRAKHDPESSYGMPAHVTVLYPFRLPHEIDPNVLAEALDAIGDHVPFEVQFDTVGTFPGGTVWLRPDPEQTFVDLTRSLMAVFPDCPPYGGRFDAIVPHLTVADGLTDVEADALAAEVRYDLGDEPVIHTVDVVSLFTKGSSRGWIRRTSIPLGTAPVTG